VGTADVALIGDLIDRAVRHVQDVRVDEIETVALDVLRERLRQRAAGFELNDEAGTTGMAAAGGAPAELLVELMRTGSIRLVPRLCRDGTAQEESKTQQDRRSGSLCLGCKQGYGHELRQSKTGTAWTLLPVNYGI
jgi:hypothetical protein